MLAAIAIVAVTVWHTMRPLGAVSATRLAAITGGELVVTATVVLLTEGWRSPFVFTLVTPVAVAGLAFGFALALTLAAAASSAVGLIDGLTWQTDARTAVQWVGELLLVAIVAGYARRVLGQSEREQSLTLTRIGQLADANALLVSLHQVAQVLPASLDLDEALDATMARIRELFDHDSAAILVLDDTDGSWLVARREGARLPVRYLADELPRPLARALAVQSTTSEDDLSDGHSIGEGMCSGVYAVLPARGSIIGLLAIESQEPGHFGQRDVELLQGFVETAALAIDNGRWFGRLRTVGADEERNRIARDLHDRIGQSLAYLAFELDRIVRAQERGNDVGTDLAGLRDELRQVVSDVRETLYDLRTDVAEDQGFLATLELFASRVRERAGLRIDIVDDESARLPLPQERELFRIAQEAITNAERHAEAGRVTVTWRCDGRRARLEVADDGKSFDVGRAGRVDSYGLLGMRERAASVGAALQVVSAPGDGTRVRCILPAGRKEVSRVDS